MDVPRYCRMLPFGSDSDIIHLNVAGKSIIILSSLQATNDLLVQQSSIYSDRQGLQITARAVLLILSQATFPDVE
jgi:hypothetical protein